MDLRQHEQQLQLTLFRFFVDTKDDPANLLAFQHNPVSLGILAVN